MQLSMKTTNNACCNRQTADKEQIRSNGVAMVSLIGPQSRLFDETGDRMPQASKSQTISSVGAKG